MNESCFHAKWIRQLVEGRNIRRHSGIFFEIVTYQNKIKKIPALQSQKWIIGMCACVFFCCCYYRTIETLLSKSMAVFYFLQEKAHFWWDVCAPRILSKKNVEKMTVMSYKHKQSRRRAGASDVVLSLPTTTINFFNCCIHEGSSFNSIYLPIWCMRCEVDEKFLILQLFSTNNRNWVRAICNTKSKLSWILSKLKWKIV